MTGRDWHSMPASEVLRRFETDQKRGLDDEEVKRRQEHFGPNVIRSKGARGPIMRFLLQFHQPLIYILIAAGSITAFFQEWVDSGVIFGVVLVNAIIGFIQESKAIKAIEALARTLHIEATVMRNGRKLRIEAAEVVPGDIVLLQAGDRVPADMRLAVLRDLQVDESALTGESVPVQKNPEPLPAETVLADRKNMAYASTLVTYGQGTGVVSSIANATEVGRISELIERTEELQTPSPGRSPISATCFCTSSWPSQP